MKRKYISHSEWLTVREKGRGNVKEVKDVSRALKLYTMWSKATPVQSLYPEAFVYTRKMNTT